MSKLIDLSHTVEDSLVTYKGLSAPVICDYLSREASKKIYAKGTTFQIIIRRLNLYVLVLIEENDSEMVKLNNPSIIFFMSKMDKMYIYAIF